MKTIAEIREDGYLKRLLLLSVPIVLSNLISQLQMVIDRIFLGNYNDLYLSALGNAMTPMWTTMSFCFSLATGASILVSQAVGAKNENQIEEYVGALVKWNNVIPVFLFFFWLFGSEFVFTLMGVSENLMPMCVTYSRFYAPVFLLCGAGGAMTVILQTSNYTVPLVIYGIVRSALNIVLDYVLIFGKFGFPEWGIKGAAIGTAIAEFVGAFVGFGLVIFNKKLKTKPSLQGIWRAKLEPYIISAKLGLNTALEDFAWNIGNLVLIVILNTISEKAAGIYSIIFSIEILAVVFVGGVGGGTMTLTSESTGKRDVRQYRGITRCAYGVCLVVIVITLVACIVAPEQIIGMFTKDNETITTSAIFLLCMSVNLFSKSGNIIVGNAIRGSGNTRWMFCTQIFGTCFVISLGCLFVFVFKLGILGVFLAVLLDEFVRVLINLWKYFRIVGNAKKTWDHFKPNQVAYVRSDGENDDFVENCKLLDEDLDRRVGKIIQRDKYQQFNTLDKIKECIIAYEDGRPVGAGAIRPYDEESIELKRVFVKQEAQGKGIGTELVKQLIGWSKELGYKRMILETGVLLEEATHVYHKLGFEVIPNYGPYENMPESICMAKKL